MEGQLAAPFHFAVEFLILAVFAGAMFDALRSAREGGGGVALVRAAGFATLVIAQIVHGSVVRLGDGSTPLVILRAVGFGLIAATMRPAPSTGLPAVFVAGTGSGWAGVPAVFAMIAAVRAFAIRRTQPGGAGSALAGSFAFFGLGEVALALAEPAGGIALIVAHAARGLGAVFMARWLWLSLIRSLRLRFVAVFIAGLVLLATVVAGALTQVISHNLEEQEFTRLGQLATGQKATLDARVQAALTYARLLGDSDTVANAYAKKAEAPSLIELARSSIISLPADLDFVAFFDRSGHMLASAIDKQPRYPALTPLQGIALSGTESIGKVLKERTSGGELTSSGDKTIAAIGAATAIDPAANQRIIGAVVVGYNLDRELLLSLRSSSVDDITILKGGEVVSTTFDSSPDGADLLAGGRRDRIRRTVEEEGRTLTGSADPGGRPVFVFYAPLTTETTNQVVGVIALSRPAGLLADSQRSINRVLFLLTLVASAIAAALAWLLSGRVTRPIRALTNAARQVRSGDLEARATVELPDEVGALGEAFNEMAESLTRMTGDLRDAADEEANLRVRVESIMQSIGDALVATDRKGHVVAVNRAAETMLGMPGEEIVGRALGDVLVGTDAQSRPLADLALTANGAHVQATVESTTGTRVPVAVSGSPLRDASGDTVGRVVLLRDISREQEAERMKSEFLSNVSHELRTPLTPIKGYTEILRRKQFPRKKTETFLDGIAESTKRLERIVEILVDFAALEAGRLKPRVEPLDVRAFLASVLDPWKGHSGRHRFVRKIPAAIPPLLGDERLLRKCLAELVDNAVKFSPEGGTIEVVAEPVAPHGRRRTAGSIRITVRDQGIGIDPSQMGGLFQDFRQLDGSETRTFGGLGLGLSYARRIALAHDGNITASSEPGHGSSFALVLPAAEPMKLAQLEKIRRKRPVSAGTRTPARKKVAAARAPKRKAPAPKRKSAAPKRKKAAPKRKKGAR